MSEREKLVQIDHLSKFFVASKTMSGKPKRMVKAVEDVTMDIYKGETVGIVGESGCGKSTLGRSILRLIEPSEGKVIFENTDISTYKKKAMRDMRKKMQIIFQDPYASLNPRMTVCELIRAPLDSFHIGTSAEKLEQVKEIMSYVGLSQEQLHRYPHEFSGGQRQRIVIARALILRPEFVVCDEPVSALDVSVRAQTLNLMSDLQEKMGLTYMFISHDLSVVKYISDRIAVMYLGKIVEFTDKTELYENPLHPYTKALLSAIPVADVNHKMDRIILKGEVPSPFNPPHGCRFNTRCQYATERCMSEAPELRKVAPGHYAACHLLDK
ncbi:dipeptide ABC transporter ATP-binding protein [Anaerolentibacter hominis]|uniref:ABC transporter ATP-binding protein n=1 Tax=Anaerolentibacter hominis TaxID=3079009 RepID=UPI0031B85297